MKLSLPLVVAAAAGSDARATGSFRSSASFYNGINYRGELGNYVPTQERNCFVFSAFTSVYASVGANGDRIDCHMFSDTNCQNEIASVSTDGTGGIYGHVPLDTNALPIQFAQSMICMFNKCLLATICIEVA